MSIRVNFSITLVVILVLLSLFLYGPSSLSVKKQINFKQLAPIPKTRDEAEMNLYLNQPLYKELDGSKDKSVTIVSKLKVPKKGVYLGISATVNNLARFEAIADKKVAVLQEYVHWGTNSRFDTTLASKLWMDNKVLIIAWNPSKSIRKNSINQSDYRLKKVLEGKYDAYINKWVLDLKEWKRPVIIRFAPEMNGDWLPWGTEYTTPEEYIETYRYIVNKFKKEKVKNVSWMWSPNVADEGIIDYYPGDSYVDWVGLSGFNWGGLQSINKWRSFEEIYDKSLEQLEEIDKPIALAEFGCVESKDDSKAKGKWIKDSFKLIRQKYSNIKLVNWSNDKSFGKYDWRIDTSTYSLGAFKEVVASDYYLGSIRKANL